MKHTRRSLFGLIGGAVSAALVAAGVKKPLRRFHYTYRSYTGFPRTRGATGKIRRLYPGIEAIYDHGELLWSDPTLDKEQG